MAKKKNEEIPKITSTETVEKFDFDVWFAMRENKVPKHHYREIIKADFKARGLEQCESLSSFDDALRKYGIKLD